MCPLGLGNSHHNITQHPRLTPKPVPRLRKGFAIQQILFVKIDFRQIVPARLDLDSTCRTRRIAAAIMIQLETERFGRLQQGEVGVDFPLRPWGWRKLTCGMPRPL